MGESKEVCPELQSPIAPKPPKSAKLKKKKAKKTSKLDSPKPSSPKDSTLAQKKPEPKQNTVRNVFFVIDNSACTLGIGNIQRWFDQEFVQSQSQNSDKIHLSLYVPQYTLRELDFQKRGPMMGVSLAHEAIKFIDLLFEADATEHSSNQSNTPQDQAETNDFSDEMLNNFDELQMEPAFKSAIPFHMYIEEISTLFPSWEKCLKYRMWHPKQKDLPHIPSADDEERMEQQAEIAPRLKNLIRSCIYVTRLKNKNQSIPIGDHWKLVTEDQATKVWATSFGIDCLNVNEAELLLFHANDVTKFEPLDPAAEFFKDKDVFDKEAPSGLHKRVDTTQYPYESIWKKKEAKMNGKNTALKGKPKASDKPPFVKVNGICYEEFDQINYAPRIASVPLVESKFFGPKKDEDSD